MAYLLIIAGLLVAGVGVFMLGKSESSFDTLPSNDVVDAEETDTILPTNGEMKEILEPDSKEKGNRFENYVIKQFQKNQYFKFINKTSDYSEDGVHPESNKNPDLQYEFQIRSMETPVKMAIECKYRSQFNENDKLFWCKEYQLKNYQNFQKENQQDVYIALGVGGEPDAPENFYLIPLYRLTKNFATRDYIADFKLDTEKKIFFDAKKKEFRN